MEAHNSTVISSRVSVVVPVSQYHFGFTDLVSGNFRASIAMIPSTQRLVHDSSYF